MKNKTASKKVIKAMSIGLAAMMAMQPVMATPVFAEDASENENISEPVAEVTEVTEPSSVEESSTPTVSEATSEAIEVVNNITGYQSESGEDITGAVENATAAATEAQVATGELETKATENGPIAGDVDALAEAYDDSIVIPANNEEAGDVTGKASKISLKTEADSMLSNDAKADGNVGTAAGKINSASQNIKSYVDSDAKADADISTASKKMSEVQVDYEELNKIAENANEGLLKAIEDVKSAGTIEATRKLVEAAEIAQKEAKEKYDAKKSEYDAAMSAYKEAVEAYEKYSDAATKSLEDAKTELSEATKDLSDASDRLNDAKTAADNLAKAAAVADANFDKATEKAAATLGAANEAVETAKADLEAAKTEQATAQEKRNKSLNAYKAAYNDYRDKNEAYNKAVADAKTAKENADSVYNTAVDDAEKAKTNAENKANSDCNYAVETAQTNKKNAYDAADKSVSDAKNAKDNASNAKKEAEQAAKEADELYNDALKKATEDKTAADNVFNGAKEAANEAYEREVARALEEKNRKNAEADAKEVSNEAKNIISLYSQSNSEKDKRKAEALARYYYQFDEGGKKIAAGRVIESVNVGKFKKNQPLASTSYATVTVTFVDADGKKTTETLYSRVYDKSYSLKTDHKSEAKTLVDGSAITGWISSLNLDYTADSDKAQNENDYNAAVNDAEKKKNEAISTAENNKTNAYTEAGKPVTAAQSVKEAADGMVKAASTKFDNANTAYNKAVADAETAKTNADSVYNTAVGNAETAKTNAKDKADLDYTNAMKTAQTNKQNAYDAADKSVSDAKNAMENASALERSTHGTYYSDKKTLEAANKKVTGFEQDLTTKRGIAETVQTAKAKADEDAKAYEQLKIDAAKAKAKIENAEQKVNMLNVKIAAINTAIEKGEANNGENQRALTALKSALEKAEEELKKAEDTFEEIGEKRDELLEEAAMRIRALTQNEAEDDNDENETSETSGTSGAATYFETVTTPSALPTAFMAALPTSGVAGARATGSVRTNGRATPVVTGNEEKSGVAGARVEEPTGKNEINQEEEKTPNTKVTTIEENEVPLAALPEETENMSWWWLLVVAVLGVTGEELYRRNRKKKMEAQAVADSLNNKQ